MYERDAILFLPLFFLPAEPALTFPGALLPTAVNKRHTQTITYSRTQLVNNREICQKCLCAI